MVKVVVVVVVVVSAIFVVIVYDEGRSSGVSNTFDFETPTFKLYLICCYTEPKEVIKTKKNKICQVGWKLQAFLGEPLTYKGHLFSMPQ